MGLAEYQAGQKLALTAAELRRNTGANEFISLIQAAIRVADTDNAMALEATFPYISHDLRDRYEAPGGVIQEDDEEQ